jgi:hypothetical protein
MDEIISTWYRGDSITIIVTRGERPIIIMIMIIIIRWYIEITIATRR